MCIVPCQCFSGGKFCCASSEALPRDTITQEMCIFSDSEFMIRPLVSPVVTYKLMKECKKHLNEVGQRNGITIVWVPGHYEVEGSEVVDELNWLHLTGMLI